MSFASFLKNSVAGAPMFHRNQRSGTDLLMEELQKQVNPPLPPEIFEERRRETPRRTGKRPGPRTSGRNIIVDLRCTDGRISRYHATKGWRHYA